MDIISLLITIAGIIIILALYLLGRVSRNKMPQENDIGTIPSIVDKNGEQFTSILDDIPATDGSTPKPIPQNTSEATIDPADIKPANSSKHQKQTKNTSTSENKQIILFISAKEDKGLDGNQVDKIFTEHGLSFGDMDIYHYQVKDSNGKKLGLFRVANGVDPWTLRPEDLKNKWLPGLSLLLVTPTQIDDRKAITTFISTAKAVSNQLNGELKNQQQQLFTQDDEEDLLKSS